MAGQYNGTTKSERGESHMARKKRDFADCDEMRDLAEAIIKKFQGQYFGYAVDPDVIRFARVISEQAKNSADVCVEENGKDWLEGTSCQFLVGVYAEKWDTWGDARKQWEMFSALRKLPIDMEGKKAKPDINDYSFILEYLGFNWRADNDGGKGLPLLLSEQVKACAKTEDAKEETAFPD